MLSIFKIPIQIILGLSLAAGIGTGFLSLPSSAKELALGQNPVIGTGLSANPALLGNFGRPADLNISYGQWLGEINSMQVSYRSDIKMFRTAVRIRHFGLNDLELRTNRPTDEALASFAASGTSLDLQLSRKWSGIQWGLAMRLIQMQVYTKSSQGWAVDAGGVLPLGKRLTLGASILNAGSMSILHKQAPELPLRLLSGLGYRWGMGSVGIVSSFSGESSSLVEGLIWRTGHQFNWRKLSLTGGFQVSKNVTVFSGGFGLSIGIYRIQYGIQAGSQGLGIPQMVDVSIRLP